VEREKELEASRKRLERLELLKDELGGKLNGLIGYLDNLPRRPPEQ